MGERNYILLENDGIYLYAHWKTKEELMVNVARALTRGRGRWTDRQYLNRIIFCAMIEDDVDGNCNYGLSKDIWDGQVAITINVKDRTVDGIDFDKVLKLGILEGLENE